MGRRHAAENRLAGTAGRRGLKQKLVRIAGGNVTLLGILSLVWLIARSGLKPWRIRYPCQRAALANTALLLGGTAVPLASRLPRVLARDTERPRVVRLVRIAEIAGAAVVVALLVVSLAGLKGNGALGSRSFDESKAAAAGLTIPALRSGTSGTSSIFVAEDIPNASEKGVDTLIDVMHGNGLDLFKSADGGKAAGPGGIIGGNDTVLIKVNGEWQQRGGTNTDVIKGLISAIVHHPDGFTGEVVIVENGQWASFLDNRADNRNPGDCNAEDHSQSFNDVAQMFAGEHRVSVYDWTAVQHNVVGEYSEGDTRDGYVYVPEKEVGYPKFTTVYGTRISLRNGVWDGAQYDNERVKFINVPVLKDHSGAGVTASLKHFMGVQDRWRNTDDAPHEPMRTEGFMARMMLLARYPDLNIVDAIWVTPSGGPNGPYGGAVRLDRLLASQDPVALDYYCGKYLLMPVSGNGRHDPDNTNTDGNYNFFHQMLVSSHDVLAGAGKQVTMDESRMNIYKSVGPQQVPDTPYEYLLAEGCTSYGFETWLLVANLGDNPAKVYVSYLTDNGPRNREPVLVPAHSRLTVNVNADAWAQNTGIRVGSDRRVYVERAMYWDDRAEGHDSTGTPSGATNWYLAEGCTSYGFETWVEILNPGGYEATASITYMTAGGPVSGPAVTVPPWTRKTVDVNGTAPGGDVGVHVACDRPVVVERTMYWGGRRGGSGSIGVMRPSRDWYLAEGATHSGFDTYLLLANPGGEEAVISLDLMTGVPGGGVIEKEVVVLAGSRKTVRLNDLVPDRDVSARVHSDVPVVAERSMYWPVAGGMAGHNSVGVPGLKKSWFLPEGCTDYGFETWLLVWNPGSEKAAVSVYAVTEGGEKKIDEFKLDPRSRRSVRVNDYYTGNLSIRVESSNPVTCERSMYWNNRSGGTSSIGY